MSSKTHPELDAFEEKFRTRELLVREFEHWLWSVRPVQATLGAGVLSLKRYAEKFSDLSERETGELARVVTVIEKTLSEAFHYDKINYLMLMMVDPHVHFHVIPRYASARSFAGREWPD
ncbi:MAG TPA: HIT family protein, partial [Dehalococcoidia bacterium]|nr:HIT family protein [Dehalococcoidia bacterium]